MKAIKATLTILILATSLYAQDIPPNTDIYLFDIKHAEEAIYFDGMVNVTDREGYDNQPWFHPDGDLMYYVAIDEEGQSDVFIYNLLEMTTERFLHSVESEYSPMLAPEHNFISVVRVEADNTTQRIWQLSQPEGHAELLIEEVDSIGYYCWINEHLLAAFVLGQPNTLQLLEVPSGTVFFSLSDPGRNMQMIPGTNKMSFVHKHSPSEWLIRSLDTESYHIEDIIPTLEGSEDYAWLPDGTLLMGKDRILYSYKEGRDEGWQVAADFSNTDINSFYRIAISPDGKRMALVVYK